MRDKAAMRLFRCSTSVWRRDVAIVGEEISQLVLEIREAQDIGKDQDCRVLLLAFGLGHLGLDWDL